MDQACVRSVSGSGLCQECVWIRLVFDPLQNSRHKVYIK